MPFTVGSHKGAHLLGSTLRHGHLRVGRTRRRHLGALAWHVGSKGQQRERQPIERGGEQKGRYDLEQRRWKAARAAPAPRFKVELAGDKAANISADHPDPAICHTLLADAFGTGDMDLACGLLVQIADVA